MSEFTYIYSHKNDGQPSPYSAEQRAINEALAHFYQAGGWEWDDMLISKLPCDQSDHYPDICYHYEILIT